MSPRPVPTSSNVALRGRILRTSLISSITALVPPKSAFALATSASDRVTMPGSTSGKSSISTPLFRGGVSRRRTSSALELRVAAAIVEQRRSILGARRFDFAKDDRMIAPIAHRDAVALDHSKHVIQNCVAVLGPAESHAVEALDVA